MARCNASLDMQRSPGEMLAYLSGFSTSSAGTWAS